jgi:transposase InsO family protein
VNNDSDVGGFSIHLLSESSIHMPGILIQNLSERSIHIARNPQLEHDRRKVLHFNVTEHPTGAWTAQQIIEAFADREAARYLIRDRDSRYSAEVQVRIKSLGIQEILTAPKSPWQNPYAEGLIGSIPRECLNHYIILNPRHLKRTLSSYFRYHHESRTHLSLGEQCPFARETLTSGKIVAIPQLGRLHHRYERMAA